MHDCDSLFSQHYFISAALLDLGGFSGRQSSTQSHPPVVAESRNSNKGIRFTLLSQKVKRKFSSQIAKVLVLPQWL